MINPHHIPSATPTAMFASLWRNRRLIWQMTKREVASRYRGSWIGLAWSFVNPLLMLFVYTFVFSVVFKARWGIGQDETRLDYAILLFAGIIVFNLFAEVINTAPLLIVTNVNYVKKVVFPLEILPVVTLGSALFHSLVSLFVLLLVLLVFNRFVPWSVILFPLVLLPLLLASLGIGWFLAALGVYVRDIGQIMRVVTTILMFLSAVFYPISALPPEYQPWLRLNPLVLVIEDTRRVLVLGQMPDWTALGLSGIAGFAIAAIGFWWFQKTRKGFADVL